MTRRRDIRALLTAAAAAAAVIAAWAIAAPAPAASGSPAPVAAPSPLDGFDLPLERVGSGEREEPQGSGEGGAAASSSAQGRIVGGGTTTASRWPWQAAVVFDSTFGGNEFSRQFCGGILIHPEIIMTAAHCVYDTDPDCGTLGCPPQPDFAGGDGTSRLDPNDVDIVLGRTNLSSSTGTIHDVSGVYIHPGYNPNVGQQFANDVAFLSLATPSARKRILIASAQERKLWTAGRDAWVTGWGTTSAGGSRSNTLRQVRIRIIGDSDCAANSDYGSNFNSGLMVCAGFMSGGRDSCQGDSGGPLSSPANNGIFRVTGIVSWGFGCAEPNRPGVYARVADNPLRDYVKAQVVQIEDAEGMAHRSVVGDGSARITDRFCAGLRANQVGTNGNDVIRGTPDRDVIVGLAGRDVIKGFGGDDVICGRAGRDIIRGGGGRDRLIGNNGNDKLLGQNGSDALIGGAGRDGMFGGNGNDRLFGGPARDWLYGGPGSDFLHGGPGRDRCGGGPGGDRRRAC